MKEIDEMLQEAEREAEQKEKKPTKPKKEKKEKAEIKPLAILKPKPKPKAKTDDKRKTAKKTHAKPKQKKPAIVLTEEPLKTRKETLNEDVFRKAIKNRFLDIYVLSSHMVIDHFKVRDIGQDWVKSEKLNRSFLIPDRSEGFTEGFKTMFFYDANNITPLTQEDKDDIDRQNTIYTFARFSENRIERFNFLLTKHPRNYQKFDEKTQKMTTVTLQPTTIDSALADRILNTNVVTEFLKIPTSMWEELKIPIIAACGALVIITMLLTM